MIPKLIQKIQKTQAPICVGLDPMLEFIPQYLLEEEKKNHGATLQAICQAVWRFNQEIIDNVFDLIPAVKLQIAMYEQWGAEGVCLFQKTILYAKEKGLIVIGDVKRGDIHSTAHAYALAHLGKTEAFGKKFTGFNEDFITVNPYLGSDGIMPFIQICQEENKGIFVLVKTSNPSSGEFQNQKIQEKFLYEMVAEKVHEWGKTCPSGDYSLVGAVVGATYPQEAKLIRKLLPHSYFLVPGYGAQGGKAKDLKAFFHTNGLGAIVNSSRGIIAAYQQENYKQFPEQEFASVARLAVIEMIQDLRHEILN
ncbi:orotidine 5'-phosphate decarboxylase [Clostridia bacterium]|nr:orotidine 5'-phosphate decarboxylase [Clostridia bacterium]